MLDTDDNTLRKMQTRRPCGCTRCVGWAIAAAKTQHRPPMTSLELERNRTREAARRRRLREAVA